MERRGCIEKCPRETNLDRRRRGRFSVNLVQCMILDHQTSAGKRNISIILQQLIGNGEEGYDYGVTEHYAFP